MIPFKRREWGLYKGDKYLFTTNNWTDIEEYVGKEDANILFTLYTETNKYRSTRPPNFPWYLADGDYEPCQIKLIRRLNTWKSLPVDLRDTLIDTIAEYPDAEAWQYRVDRNSNFYKRKKAQCKGIDML